MPLHLLPKKSWNVYNSENIARVRADEAAAAAAEAVEEQRLQEEDAARRLAILRGDDPSPPSRPAPRVDTYVRPKRPRDGPEAGGYIGRTKRRRKQHGEDDTEFELRLARERQEQVSALRLNLGNSSIDAPITDDRGNISLFALDIRPESLKQPNPEAEADRKKKQEREDPTLRFSHASGRNNSVISKTAPWYHTSAREVNALVHSTGTNAFGQSDPERYARDAKRLDTADPLTLMKRGAKRVREVKKEREMEREEREREVRRLGKEQRRERRERKRKRREKMATGDPGDPDTDKDSLEGFSLDASSKWKSTNDEGGTYRDNGGRHRHKDHHYNDRSSKRRRSRSSGRT